MTLYALQNRKIPSYISQNELSSATNRKFSAYSTITNDAIIDKTSSSKGIEVNSFIKKVRIRGFY
jgi:hypothetical protein